MSTYVFDLDGTLCSNTNGDYLTAQPQLDRIPIVNQLYKEGHTIIILTARGMGRSGNNRAIAESEWAEITAGQLKAWGVFYHELHLGKPAGDFYIDDKAIRDKDFFNK